MNQQKFHVAIIGAGLGGLCLAQGLKRRDIAFTIYEKDAAPASRTQGYRIRIDETGQRALAACLPSALNRLFRQTCAISLSQGCFLDPRLRPTGGRPSENWRPSAPAEERNGEVGDLSVNRLTLREILLCGIEEHVRFGKAFSRFERREDGTIDVRFEDGRGCEASILVAADGVNSPVRRQAFPLADPADSGAVCVYGKSTMRPRNGIAEPLLSGTSVIFADDFAVIVDAMTFRFPAEAAGLTQIGDYLYWAVIGRRAALALDDGALGQPDGATLLAKVERLARCWADGLRAVFAEADSSTVTALPIRIAAPLAPWPASRVTILGDAIHAMSPAGGVGANTALDDAAHLAERLGDAAMGECCPLEAIAAYEADMRRRGNAAIAASVEAARRLFNEATPT